MSTTSGGSGTQFFTGSSNPQLHNPQFLTWNVQIDGTQTSFDGLRLLEAEVAPNAILNSGGRADDVRCHSGTREDIISKAEHWMTVGYRTDRRIFWLSGPAGAGKSAIMQTLAERCNERKAPMANFFFFRADATRNHLRPFVATLLHQLMETMPSLRVQVNEIIRQNRLVFKQSLHAQIARLIDEPVRILRKETPTEPPIVLLIDGLDECDYRPDLNSETRSEQTALINALHELVTSSDSPFVVLVASRAESHIAMAFNKIGSHMDSIYLDDNYRADNDIRLYLTSELGRIKRVHPLRRMLDGAWPSQSVIDDIVEKSSGQFIYASTIARFIADSPQSPAFSMQSVLNVHPTRKHSPFAEIDAMYMFILNRSQSWHDASEIIALDMITDFSVPPSVLGHSDRETVSFFSDLSSIIGHPR